MGNLPRVFLHDGALRRIGEVTTLGALDRSYLLGEESVCQTTVSPEDPLFAELQPTKGRILVVESPLYPLLWVGKVTQARRGAERGAVTVTARSYDRILSERVLGPQATYTRGCSEAILRVLADVNATNPTGIAAGRRSDNLALFNGSLPYETARSALDKIADFGGLEWWLSYYAETGGTSALTIRLNVADARGVDAYRQCTLVDGGNARWDDWIEDAEALTFGLTVVGGQATSGQPFNERPATKIDATQVVADAPHGYQVEGAEPNLSAITKADRIVVAEYLRAEGLTNEAARAQIARQRLSGATRSLRVTVTEQDAGLWAFLQPGNVVRIVMPTAFWSGFDGPARIVGVQPDEQAGGCGLVLRLLRAPDAA